MLKLYTQTAIACKKQSEHKKVVNGSLKQAPPYGFQKYFMLILFCLDSF